MDNSQYSNQAKVQMTAQEIGCQRAAHLSEPEYYIIQQIYTHLSFLSALRPRVAYDSESQVP